MDKKKKEMIIYSALSVVLLVIVLVLITGLIRTHRSKSDPTQISNAAPSNGKKLFDDAKVVEEVVTVNTQIIEDGLKEMGLLTTEEYYFTQVEEYSSSKKVFIFESKATFTYSYDGVVTAGIDCNDVIIDKNDELRKITITVPKATIFGANIDHDSFKIYEEKEGLWNKIDMTKYNDSIIEFENAAIEKAKAKGIVEKADEGARKIIGSFVNSLVDTDDYEIEIVSG